MNTIIAIVLLVLLALFFCILLGITYKRHAIKKVNSMTVTEKCSQMNTLLAPFGYNYDSSLDIITSRDDAWQRIFGYTAFFDKAAPHFHMVFDALPIYFDYQGHTWLIEFWKGQYGINIGGEIGVYYAKEIIPKNERTAELFHAVADTDTLPMYFALYKNNTFLCSVSKTTWWLTAFCMGLFSQPKDLCLEATINFPNYEMQRSFLTALLETGIPEKYVKTSGKQVQILFNSLPASEYSLWCKVLRQLTQLGNKILCSLFLRLTSPFTLTSDRLLYIYYLLPFLRHKILSPRKCKHRYRKRRQSK